MEIENNLLENELLIDSVSQVHLKETAMWAKFLAIAGFIISILIAIGAVFAGTMFNKLTAGMPGGNKGGVMTGGVIMVMYLLIAAVAFFMSLFLFRFGVKMKAALIINDQESLNISFQNLKVYYRFAGIITIIYLVILLLALLGGIIAATITHS
jgi:hypothetical protein